MTIAQQACQLVDVTKGSPPSPMAEHQLGDFGLLVC